MSAILERCEMSSIIGFLFFVILCFGCSFGSDFLGDFRTLDNAIEFKKHTSDFLNYKNKSSANKKSKSKGMMSVYFVLLFDILSLISRSLRPPQKTRTD